MICKKCGKKIEDDRLFCPACGTEQMIPEYNRVEDALQENMDKIKKDTRAVTKRTVGKVQPILGSESLQIPHLTEKESISQPKENTRKNLYEGEKDSWKPNIEEVYDNDEEWEEEFHLAKKVTKKQKRMKLIAAITALSVAIVAAIVIMIVLLVSSLSNRSFDKRVAEGDDFWKNGQYESAITSFENAVEQAENSKEKMEVLCKLASLYIESGDDNSAIYYYESAAEVEKLSDEDLSTLVNLYEKKTDINAIRKLAEKYSNKENESIFERHLLNQPVFNYKSGTYNELLTVDISAANNEQIFYTLDNSEATPQSTPYTEPLQIGEGTTIVRAVALNANGLLSDEIITTYEVQLDVPPTPIITPETGNYAENTKITFQNIPTNCKAYYTIDGTIPTKDSIEYKEPFNMLLGNYVIKAVCINQYTEKSGQVAMKIYDLSIGGKISYAQASGRVMNRLQEKGEIIDGDGTLSNGEKCTLLATTINKIGNTNYYIVKRFHTTNAGLKEQGAAYAVDVNTGAVFLAEDNGAGQFNLSGL